MFEYRVRDVMVELLLLAVLWWSLSSLPWPLEGAAVHGLHLSTPDPGFHQRTPVPNPLVRSLVKEARRWIITVIP